MPDGEGEGVSRSEYGIVAFCLVLGGYLILSTDGAPAALLFVIILVLLLGIAIRLRHRWF
jgi:hypothetical protein